VQWVFFITPKNPADSWKKKTFSHGSEKTVKTIYGSEKTQRGYKKLLFRFGELGEHINSNIIK
jgi:hypothetical protein